ncbi:hypothetical protein PIB30_095349 [Stylosanthes scabra]|uniref:Retrotransposon gag domain-containing protein n=1 Tax=Stylosanthes scabra TaxID=79078 RepID=A0ABU6XSE7_9FABA|nr:hypothetical protein [Stylosanthes scabra]
MARRGAGIGRGTSSPSTASPSTSATPGSTQPSAASSSPYSSDDSLVDTSTSSNRLDHYGTSRPAGYGFYTRAIGNHGSRIITWIPAGSGDRIERQEEDPAGRHERANEITNVIKLMYDETWPNWKDIPTATRDRMFEKWAEKFTWDKDDDDVIKAIFKTRASKRFSGIMEDVQERKEHLTQWCRPELKKLLYHYWETDEKYLHCKAINKRNRASEKCAIYTGGSATSMQTKAKMTKLLDRPVSMAEVFKQTHTLKANKEKFADKRSSNF